MLVTQVPKIFIKTIPQLQQVQVLSGLKHQLKAFYMRLSETKMR